MTKVALVNDDPWFSIHKRIFREGRLVILFGVKLNLSPRDIHYLLFIVDGAATSQSQLVRNITFVLRGHTFHVTDMQWADFIDSLLSSVYSESWFVGCNENL